MSAAGQEVIVINTSYALQRTRTAVNRLRELKSKSKIAILMTDGQNNSGKVAPLTAAEAAEALRVKVYTIGVGKRGTAPMPGWISQPVAFLEVQVRVALCPLVTDAGATDS